MKTALLSDIHGNTFALDAVLEDIRRQQVDQVYVLGDIVNGLDPRGCMARLAAWRTREPAPLTCIKGNAELYLLTPNLDALPNHGQAWEREVLALIRWCQAQLTPADLAWIISFPDYLLQDGTCLVHDSPAARLTPETWHAAGTELKYQEWFYHARGLPEDLPAAEWQKLEDFMFERKLTRVFCGHTHRPYLLRLGSRVVCNTGSVGAPLDGDPRASWVLLEEPPVGEPAITIRRVSYDIAALHRLADATPDYPDFQRPGYLEAYKLWRSTGGHP
jgi:predicted phosphodiesterase